MNSEDGLIQNNQECSSECNNESNRPVAEKTSSLGKLRLSLDLTTDSYKVTHDKVHENVDPITVQIEREVIPMSPEAKARLLSIAEHFAGRECFPESNARAREILAKSDLSILNKPE